MNWSEFVSEVEPIFVPRIKASKVGFAASKTYRDQSTTLVQMLR